ncbi:hypothetical protein PVIIG_01828 [Plasmodium vivax India VII]|uniref:Pv-fam-d protein n=3 Tax=Plasmodium vivax TaxID=5855 RepID=A0A0J9TKE4_PLAVI|nr:hypothetical protein PVIIG_01828 [Plasmodium vivax India VII]KMZ95242.1 hypothetical protein PVMG_05880 [Plasmodium vivax Mauritania I]KNA01782.1 hypothetical protein PVNG_05571 [Plasmodium vivax North Korean]
MAEQTSKFSFFSKIVACSLLVLSSTFVESWDSAACQENAVRTSRLLTAQHTLIGNSRTGQYKFLKNKVIDLLDDEYDDEAFGQTLNELVQDQAFRNTYRNIIQDEKFQKRSYRDLDASFDDMREIYEIKKGVQKKSEKTDDSLDMDCFYDDEASSSTSASSMALEKYEKPRKSRKSARSERKKRRRSTRAKKYDYKHEENFETLKDMVIKASAEEEPSEGGMMGALKKFDKQFEVELLRSVKDKALSDYDECKFKAGKGKYQHVMNKFRVYLPPTINMAILMIMLVFQSTLFNAHIFAFFSLTFFAMIAYYGKKFAQLHKMKKFYKGFDRRGSFRKPIKY